MDYPRKLFWLALMQLICMGSSEATVTVRLRDATLAWFTDEAPDTITL